MRRLVRFDGDRRVGRIDLVVANAHLSSPESLSSRVTDSCTGFGGGCRWMIGDVSSWHDHGTTIANSTSSAVAASVVRTLLGLRFAMLA